MLYTEVFEPLSLITLDYPRLIGDWKALTVQYNLRFRPLTYVPSPDLIVASPAFEEAKQHLAQDAPGYLAELESYIGDVMKLNMSIDIFARDFKANLGHQLSTQNVATVSDSPNINDDAWINLSQLELGPARILSCFHSVGLGVGRPA